jgi:phage baseplate assembly protein W
VSDIDLVLGIGVPFGIDPTTGGVATTSGADKIRQNLRVLLTTRTGERPMQRDFGTRIPTLAFEPNDDVLVDLIETQARQAMLQWEPRVIVTNTALVNRNDTGYLELEIDYVFVNEQLAGQMVLPIA